MKERRTAYFILNLDHLRTWKSLFTGMWSCHVTLTSNSENFYLSPNSILNFRKIYQIWGKLAQEQKSYRQKTNWGMENTPPPPPPVLIELNTLNCNRKLINTGQRTKRLTWLVSKVAEYLLYPGFISL